MMWRRILLATLFAIFTCVATQAETFVVTSNADSGPGTLREALTKAASNGTTERDFITFNLPDLSEAGRTITLTSALPELTSNLEIDGTTQPGDGFGVSDAKVKLYVLNYIKYDNTACFYINKKSYIGIFGLFLDRAPALFDIDYQGYGIYAEASNHIQIGSPGRGCLIRNFENNIAFQTAQSGHTGTDDDLAGEVNISSNIIGLNEDGMSACVLGMSNLSFNTVREIKFGGHSVAEGNTVYGNMVFSKLFESYTPLGNLLIANNKIGLNYQGTAAITGAKAGYKSHLVLSDYSTSRLSCEISSNTLSGAITLTSAAAFVIKGNRFGTDITGTKILPETSIGLSIEHCEGAGIIGGTDPDDANIFAGEFQNLNVTANDYGVVLNIGSKKLEVVGNVFKCNNGIRALRLLGLDFVVPVISTRTATIITGTAAPNSRVDFYYSLECDYCEPQQLFAHTIADANGNWNYNGTLLNKAIIAAGTVDGLTTEFTTLKFINKPADVITHDACGGTGGYVKGIRANGALTYTWYNEAGMVVSNSADLTDVSAGKYHLVASDGHCSITSADYEILETGTQINITGRDVKDATCDNYDGYIKGVTATGGSNLTYIWKNDRNNEFTTPTPDLENVPPGEYRLTVTNDAGCTTISDPITIKSSNGVTITGVPHVESERCEGNNGSITGITIEGATTIEWRRESDNQLVSTKADLINMPAGRYVLRAFNNDCPGFPRPFDIAKLAPIVYPDFPATITPACSNVFTNGQISINTDNAPSQPLGFIWMDSNGTEIGYGKTSPFVAPGKYKLDLIDANGCRNFYKEYTVGIYPQFAYILGATTDIQCGVGLGKIGPPQLSGGRGADNYIFSWYAGWDPDAALIPGENKSSLDNVQAGKYRLHVEDGGCSNYDLTYEIRDYDLTPPPPVVPDLRLAGAGSAQLQVTDPYPTAIYNLYDSETNPTPTDSEIGGKFNIFPTENRTYYVSLTYGRCESTRTKVTISLCITSKDIANTFSPNGDGVNDYWNIKGLEFNTAATVQVFNRSGRLVYQSRGYAKPFDGNYNGKPLPYGTYYYIIETGTECGKFAGNLTILR